MSYQFFTSESVAAGHPDKIADAISDALLDAILAQDPDARTGIETIVGANRVGLYGEVTTTAIIDYVKVTQATIAKLGYTNPDWNFSNQSPVDVYIHQQSKQIALGVDIGGAGDQGMMFGYACNDTPELMPLPIVLAHALTRRLDQVRENNILGYIRPDGKSQVTVKYDSNKPVAIAKVVLAVAHDEKVTKTDLDQDLFKHVIEPVLAQNGNSVVLDDVVINGTGLWHIPGPDTDAGLTGRKIIVDGYGGYARVGGGAFSGKDASKVDRSGAYAARYIAKNIVAKGLADRCEVALAYVIGQPKPIMQSYETFGTSKVEADVISDYANELIDTSVAGIVKHFGLLRPIYSSATAYGHFGKSELPWEKVES
jgi:S-adenosylmethionine synthetase